MADIPSPQLDFSTARDLAHNLHDTLLALFQDWSVPGWLSEMIASSAGGLVFCGGFVFLAFLQIGIALGSWVAAAFLNALDTAKEENQDNINGVIAAAANEMLGTKLDAGDLNGGSGDGGSMDGNKALGGALLDIFEEAFGGGGPVTPAQGADNARKFAGFAVNFATSQAFLSILSEAASLGVLKEFHELPDALMHSLGLGRLQRLALQPLIQDAIQKPYQRFTRAQYRPTRLAEPQLVRAMHSGKLSEAVVTQELQELGYPDDLIELLLADLSGRLSLAELILLLNNGDVTEEDVINNLTLGGMPEDQAKLQLKAAQLSPARTQQLALLSELENAYVGGFVTQETYNQVLGNLSLGDLEEQAFRAKVGFKQEVPRKTLTFAEVKAGIVDLVIDFGYLDTWFANAGYDDQAQLVLSFEVLAAIKDADNKRVFARYKADQLKAKGKPVPPWITAAE